MRLILTFGCFFLFFGCSNKISEDDLKNLNGYWEIRQVTLPDGKTKDYKVNTTVDFIQMDGLTGYRKKVQPQFDGTYNTSDDAEKFALVKTDGSYILKYKNELSEWTERLTKLNANSFSVVNEESIRYDYVRFESIKVSK